MENYEEYPDTSSNDNSYVVETLYVDGQPFEEFNRARDLNYCKVNFASADVLNGFLKVRCLDNYLIGKTCPRYQRNLVATSLVI